MYGVQGLDAAELGSDSNVLCSRYGGFVERLVVWSGVDTVSTGDRAVDEHKGRRIGTVNVDATGVGEPVASFLRQALGSKVVPFKFTQKTKSEAGFELLAAVNSGRLKLYKQDGSQDYKELMFELEKARSFYRPNQTLSFFVHPSDASG